MGLVTTDLTVHIGNKFLLQGVNLWASPGEVTAIVGPSGAGKTTLLSALSGDIGYDGQVTLNGMDAKSVAASELAQHRAVLAQSTPLAFPFTVYEITRLGLAPGGDVSIVAQALKKVGMSAFASAHFQSLSGGEQQRVQLARVLCQVWQPVKDGVPRWLFLDEPVSSLDIGQQLRVMQIARAFADQGGGVVTVMHDLNLTAMYSDQVALIQDGRLVTQGAASEALTSSALSDAYRCDVKVNASPDEGFYVLPQLAQVSLGA